MVVAACEKVIPTLRTGDAILFLSASWTAPHVTAVTGQPYSHAGLLVVDETTVPGQRIVLDYEATNNKSGTPKPRPGRQRPGRLVRVRGDPSGGYEARARVAVSAETVGLGR